MSRSTELLQRAVQDEALARMISLETDRAYLLDEAQRWRSLAAAVEARERRARHQQAVSERTVEASTRATSATCEAMLVFYRAAATARRG